MPISAGPHSILGGLALRNLGGRTTRTTLLVGAVALTSAIAFSGAVMSRSIQSSLDVGFSRLGADLMVVARGALTNITTTLLTVEPTDTTVDANIFERAAIPGIARVAPQRVFRSDRSGFGGGGSVDIIGFDVERDFTIRSWTAERLGRPMAAADVIIGAKVKATIGSGVTLFGKPFQVYAKLEPTASGTHERGVFLDTQSFLALGPAIQQATGETPPVLRPDRVTGFLVELAPGATELQVRFALLAYDPNIKVISGGSLLTGIRQGLTALVGGMFILVALMLASAAVLVGVLFSAIIAERRRELGLLKAIGARRSQIAGTLVIEAVIATGAGGLVGVLAGMLVLRLFERSLVYHLKQIGVPFLWLDRTGSLGLAAACIAGAALVGGVGAFIPAWRAAGREPYDLIQDKD